MMGWKMDQVIEYLKSPSRPVPKVVDRGETFGKIVDIEIIEDGNGKAAVDEEGRVRVRDVLTGEEVVEDMPKEKERKGE